MPVEPAQTPARASEFAKPITRRFRRSFPTPRVAPDVSQRHGRAVTAAFLALGSAEAASAYVNAHDASLGGRPLDIAGDSPAGLATVEAHLKTLAAPA